MTEKIKLSVAEIADLANKAKKKGINSGLPATRAGVNRRVTKQGWESEDIPTAGGKNGFKKLYTIPSYIIEELKEKGVLDLLTPGKEGSSSTQSGKYPAGRVGALASALKEPIYEEYGVVKREKPNLPVVPLSMQQMVKEYADWSEKQDTAEIVPVRYHTSVFASAASCGTWKPKPCGSEPRSSNIWASRPNAASARVSRATACSPPSSTGERCCGRLPLNSLMRGFIFSDKTMN